MLAEDERILEIERQLSLDVRSRAAAKPARLRRTASAVAQLDVLAAFAKLSADRGYTRPQFNTSGELLIVAGRHPVIEELLRQRGERFVPNDLCFEPGRQQLLLITARTWARSPSFSPTPPPRVLSSSTKSAAAPPRLTASPSPGRLSSIFKSTSARARFSPPTTMS